MPESKSSRKNAIKKLAQSSKGRDVLSLDMASLYPYGIFSRASRNPAYDRDIAITSTVLLEQGLEFAILNHLSLRDDADDMLFSNQSPILRDFSEKIRLAYILGIIGPLTMSDLGCIRAIRNAFAHSRRALDFDMQEFKDVIDQISTPNRWARIMKGNKNHDQREIFIQTCFQLTLFLFVGHVDKEADRGKIMDERLHTFQQ